MWQCSQHKVCRTCLFKLFEPQGVVTCPYCRADSVQPLCVGFHSESAYLWTSDDNFAIYGDRQNSTARTMRFENFNDLLNVFSPGEVVMGARVDASGALLYLAAGRCSEPFFDLFKPTPPFIPAQTGEDRLRRRLQRDLYRELLAFCTCDGDEDVRNFLETYIFPIELHEVEMSDQEDEEMA